MIRNKEGLIKSLESGSDASSTDVNISVFFDCWGKFIRRMSCSECVFLHRAKNMISFYGVVMSNVYHKYFNHEKV